MLFFVPVSYACPQALRFLVGDDLLGAGPETTVSGRGGNPLCDMEEPN
jgi:hypothetical protein